LSGDDDDDDDADADDDGVYTSYPNKKIGPETM